jgi:hypothetical protein
MRCIHIGLLCVQENIAYRPTMTSIVQMLNCHSSSLPPPARPAFRIYSDIERELPQASQHLESNLRASGSQQYKDIDETVYSSVH